MVDTQAGNKHLLFWMGLAQPDPAGHEEQTRRSQPVREGAQQTKRPPVPPIRKQALWQVLNQEQTFIEALFPPYLCHRSFSRRSLPPPHPGPTFAPEKRRRFRTPNSDLALRVLHTHQLLLQIFSLKEFSPKICKSHI